MRDNSSPTRTPICVTNLSINVIANGTRTKLRKSSASISALIYPRSYAQIEERLGLALAGNEQQFAATFHDPEECLRHFSLAYFPDLDPGGSIRGIFMFATDETAQRRAAEAVYASEAKFRALFERTALGIALIDNTGATVDSNPRFQPIAGYDDDELHGFRRVESTTSG